MDRKYIEETAVKSAPVYKLTECFALKAEEEYGQNLGKIEEIKIDFKQHIYFFEDEKIKFINNLTEQMKDGEIILKGDEINLEGFFPYDYIYLFFHENGLYMVLPDELRDIYINTTNEENFEEIRARNLEMLKYAVALTNLYGIYEIKQFVSVWNQHHKEKTDYEKAESFINKSCDYTFEYFADEYYVYSESFQDDADIDDLLEEVEKFKYYMPPKSVINLYSEDDHYEKVPGAAAMADFLNKYVPNDHFKGDTLRLDILLDCRRLVKPIDIVNNLNEYGFPVENKEVMKEFERLYRILFDNTHMWLFRGFTPSQFESETGNKIKSFKIPEFDLVEKSKNKKR
jgi:hypothetical protein